MSKWAFAIAGLYLILASCANNNVVAVQPTPPRATHVNWGNGWWTLPANATQPEPCKQPSAPQLANQPGYRQLTISLDSSGDAPTKLSQGDLKIRDGTQEIPVQLFQSEAASVGLLVDTSGSMEPKMRQAETTLTDLIDGLNPNDQAFLMAFSSRPFVLQAFTSDHTWLKRRVDSLHAFGQTSLLDSIILGLQAVKHGCYEKKALFVMTDGMDNVSVATPSEVIAGVKKAGVPIYALGIGREGANRALFMGPFRIGADADEVDARTLRLLAETSAGKWYLLPMIGDAQAKETASAIANEIDNHYTVGFVAPANSKIQIDLLNHPGATLKIEGAPPDIAVVNGSHS
jgi:VWFA-related protein